MNAREFYDLVVNMRQAQKEYYKNKTNNNLIQAMDLERQVDKEITRVTTILELKLHR